jgi:hypothetical protein
VKARRIEAARSAMHHEGITLGRAPVAPERLRLSYIASLFRDQSGNFVVTLADGDRPMGLDQHAKRPPSVYLAETDNELEVALEQMLFRFERCTSATGKHVELARRVWNAIARRNGHRPERPAIH